MASHPKARLLVFHGGSSLLKEIRARVGPGTVTISGASTVKEAQAIFSRHRHDVIFFYAGAQNKARIAEFLALRKRFPEIPIGILTKDTIEDAIAAELNFPNASYCLQRNRVGKGFMRRVLRETFADRDLRTERDFNAAVLDSAAALMMVLSPKGVIERANEAFRSVLGYAPSGVVGKHPWDFIVGKEGIATARKLVKSPPPPGQVVRHNLVLRAKDGNTRHISLSSVAVCEKTGAVRYFVCTGMDITDWVIAQDNLKQSEMRFSRVFNASPAVFAVTRLSDGLHYDVNKRWLSVLGYAPKEVIGKTIKEMGTWVDPEVRKRLVSAVKKKGAVRDFECQLRTKSGEARDFLITAEKIVMDGEDRLLFLANDVTEIKRAEAELRQRNETEKEISKTSRVFQRKKFDSAMKSTLSGLGEFLKADFVSVYRFDLDPDIMINTHSWDPASKHSAPLENLKKANFPYGISCFEKGEPSIVSKISDIPAWAKAERKEFKRQGTFSTINVPFLLGRKTIGCLSADFKGVERDWSDNEIRLVSSAAEAMALGILADESEEKLKSTLKDLERRVQERTSALKESELRLLDMMEAASDWRWECDSQLRFSRFSKSADRILGFNSDKLIGKVRADQIAFSAADGKSGTDMQERWRRHLEDMKDRKPFRDFQYPFKRPDGETRYIRISGKPVFKADGSFDGYRGTGTDVTAQVEAEQRAARAQMQLVEAIESIDGGLLLLDRNYEFVLCNTRYREEHATLNDILVPKTPFEDLVRASVERDVVDIGDIPLDDWIAMRLRRSMGLKQTSEQLMTNGRWALVSDYVTRDGGRLVVSTDITTRKRAEMALRASEERRRLILKTVIDGIITIDGAGVVQSLNPAAESIFGYTADEVEGRNVSMLMPEPYRGEHDSYLKNYISTGQAKIIGIGREVEGRRKDGTVFPLDLAVSQTEINDALMFVGVIRDITKQKRSESDLQHARFEAEASNRAKSQFLANMSHELRTPLNAIIGFSETITSELFGPIVNDRYRDYIDNIRSSGRHLLNLINDILDLSKIEAGALDLDKERTKIDELISSSLAFVSSQSHDRNITVRTDVAGGIPEYFLDQRRMKQVLLNLLSNALKFANPGGTVLVSAVVATDGDLVISVHDDGIGMTPEEVDLALLEFGQVQSAREHSRAHEGTGLGLPLSRNLVSIHGGRLVIDSEKGKGTTVSIRFPASLRAD